MHSEMMRGFGGVPEGTHSTVREVVAVANELGVSAAQVALAWLRYRPAPVIPIIGARKFHQIEDNIRSLEVQLSPAHLDRLEKASAVSMGFPHDFMALDSVRTIVFGGMRDRIKA
jgi:aryl-alcohol dehydrogenase-like predicted oxidoreductase